METLNVKLEGDAKILEVRQGDCLPLREPVKMSISGLINSPYNYLSKRLEEVDLKASHLTVDMDSRGLSLHCDEGNHYGAEINGKVKLDKGFEGFGINTSKMYTTFDLADFIKMNRYCFEKKDIAMSLVTLLRNFKAKVDKDVENSDDSRGNKRMLLSQKIESNIPESFKLVMPIFAGQEKVSFEVEININDNFECSLISPDANDVVKDVGEGILEEEIKKIEKLAPDLVILNLQ